MASVWKQATLDRFFARKRPTKRKRSESTAPGWVKKMQREYSGIHSFSIFKCSTDGELISDLRIGITFSEDYRIFSCDCSPGYLRSTGGSSSNIVKHRNKHCHINSLVQFKTTIEPATLSQADFNKLVRKAFVQNNLSFEILHEETFKQLLLEGRGRHRLTLMSRRELARQLSTDLETMKNTLRKSISKATSRVSITLDLWTDKASRPFLAITGHYFDADHKLKGPLLSLQLLPKYLEVQQRGLH